MASQYWSAPVVLECKAYFATIGINFSRAKQALHSSVARTAAFSANCDIDITLIFVVLTEF
jgi:hypothetical protein